jgi:glutamine synthetase
VNERIIEIKQDVGSIPTISTNPRKNMIKAEYIWLDGSQPTAQIRSKTKVLHDGERLPIWGFDGSSTNQADGYASDCVLNPVFSCSDPVRGEDNILVLCEVLNVDGTPHKSNTRNECVVSQETYNNHDCWFGLEQEYTLMTIDGHPYGFALARREGSEILPQGPYYCSTGAGLAIGRKVAEAHLDACLAANLKISGINAEVMPGQWEFQIGPCSGVESSDHLIIARWLLHRIAEDHGVVISFDGKPADGDWNGAGCHTNFSTELMRTSYEACITACRSLSENPDEHIKNYGARIEDRLTGRHETCSHRDFKFGVSDRGASIRIPWQVEKDGCGYIEDRRPNANCDPYLVTKVMMNTVCANEQLRIVKRAYAPPY